MVFYEDEALVGAILTVGARVGDTLGAAVGGVQTRSTGSTSSAVTANSSIKRKFLDQKGILRAEKLAAGKT